MRRKKNKNRSTEIHPEAGQDGYYFLNTEHTDPARLKKEREIARELKKTSWWQQKLQKGVCEYCGEKKAPGELTMDHRVALARGGKSSKGNIVACCLSCNQKKKLQTPVEQLLSQKKGSSSE